MFTKKPIFNIFLLFLTWRIWIISVAIFGMIFIPLQSKNFLGGGLDNYLNEPIFWAWGNFDGEHYVAIAQHGYKALEHSFFPLYPLIIRLFSSADIKFLSISGLIISNMTFLMGLIFFVKLIKIDFKEPVAFWSIIALLTFPTSFYFGSVYTASLFFLLTILSFFFARKGNWFLAGIAGAFACAARINGILLLPALLVEWLVQKKKSQGFIFRKKWFREVSYIFLLVTGLSSYMYFLYIQTGDPIKFYSDLTVYGVQRSNASLTLLPQVFWRYIKMVLTVDRTSILYFSVWMEFLSGIGGAILLFVAYFKKIRLSYLVFAIFSYILPTLTGSFSSVPRYFLYIFPFFIVIGKILAENGKIVKLVYFFISVVLGIAEIVLFAMGYWVA